MNHKILLFFSLRVLMCARLRESNNNKKFLTESANACWSERACMCVCMIIISPHLLRHWLRLKAVCVSACDLSFSFLQQDKKSLLVIIAQI